MVKALTICLFTLSVKVFTLSCRISLQSKYLTMYVGGTKIMKINKRVFIYCYKLPNKIVMVGKFLKTKKRVARLLGRLEYAYYKRNANAFHNSNSPVVVFGVGSRKYVTVVSFCFHLTLFYNRPFYFFC